GSAEITPNRPPALTNRSGSNDQQSSVRDDVLLDRAAQVKASRMMCSQAFQKPIEEPERPASHHDYMLKEARWLAEDFTQERSYKLAAARALAQEAAAFHNSSKSLRQTAPGDEMRKAAAQADDAPALRERKRSNSFASTSGSGRRQSIKKEASVLESNVWEPGHLIPGLPMLPCWQLTYHITSQFSEAVVKQVKEAADRRAIAHALYAYDYEIELAAAKLATAKAGKHADHDNGEQAAGTSLVSPPSTNKAESRLKKPRRPPLHLDDFIQDNDFAPTIPTTVQKPGRPRPDPSTQPTRRTDGKRPTKRPRFPEEDLDDGSLARRDQKTAPRHGPGPKRSSEMNKKQKTKHANSMEALANQGGKAGKGHTPWTPTQDDLLCAIVLEFGPNWSLISDVISTSLSAQGLYRRADVCKARFKSLAHEEQGLDESLIAQSRVSKVQAREILQASLPIPTEVQQDLNRHLLATGSSARLKSLQEVSKAKESNHQPAEPHQSHRTMMSVVYATAQKSTPLFPLELIQRTEAAEQQALQAQQAQQAQVQAVAQAQAGSARSAGTPVAGQPSSSHNSGQAIGSGQQAPPMATNLGVNSHPQPGGMQQMPGQFGAAAAAAAPAASPAALAMSAGMSPAALSPQNGGLPMGMSGLGQGGQGMAFAGANAHNSAQMQALQAQYQQRARQYQSLKQILSQKPVPIHSNGKPYTEQEIASRKQDLSRLGVYLQQLQQQQHQGVPGLHLAHQQAQQQAAVQQQQHAAVAAQQGQQNQGHAPVQPSPAMQPSQPSQLGQAQQQQHHHQQLQHLQMSQQLQDGPRPGMQLSGLGTSNLRPGGYGLAGGLQGQQQQRAGARGASSGLANPMSPMLSDGIHTSAAQSLSGLGLGSGSPAVLSNSNGRVSPGMQLNAPQLPQHALAAMLQSQQQQQQQQQHPNSMQGHHGLGLPGMGDLPGMHPSLAGAVGLPNQRGSGSNASLG
ncbi:hypothetical protein WJX84_002732, partial [Apatococcus fuscideae]